MIKARLFAMGTQRELLSTQLTYYRTVNPKTGRSGSTPMGGLATLAFTSGDGDDRLLRWITHSPEGELCTLTKAKIVFYEGNLDGIVLFEYNLHDAALVHWKEEFKATGTAPMTVTITISAAIQNIKEITWIKPWRESRVLSEEIVAHKEGVQRGVSHDRGKEKDGSALEGVVLEVAGGSTKIDDIGKAGAKVDIPKNRVESPGKQMDKYKSFKETQDVPEKYRNDPGFEDLVKDPDHDFAIKPATRAEAMAGLEAEAQGLIKGPIERGPKRIEFYDADGNPWDVKAPPSAKPEQRDFFDAEVSGLSILNELRAKKTPPGTFPNKYTGEPTKMRIILDSTYLKPKDHKALWDWLNKNLTSGELGRIVEVNTKI